MYFLWLIAILFIVWYLGIVTFLGTGGYIFYAAAVILVLIKLIKDCITLGNIAEKRHVYQNEDPLKGIRNVS